MMDSSCLKETNTILSHLEFRQRFFNLSEFATLNKNIDGNLMDILDDQMETLLEKQMVIGMSDKTENYILEKDPFDDLISNINTHHENPHSIKQRKSVKVNTKKPFKDVTDKLNYSRYKVMVRDLLGEELFSESDELEDINTEMNQNTSDVSVWKRISQDEAAYHFEADEISVSDDCDGGNDINAVRVKQKGNRKKIAGVKKKTTAVNESPMKNKSNENGLIGGELCSKGNHNVEINSSINKPVIKNNLRSKKDVCKKSDKTVVTLESEISAENKKKRNLNKKSKNKIPQEHNHPTRPEEKENKNNSLQISNSKSRIVTNVDSSKPNNEQISKDLDNNNEIKEYTSNSYMFPGTSNKAINRKCIKTSSINRNIFSGEEHSEMKGANNNYGEKNILANSKHVEAISNEVESTSKSRKITRDGFINKNVKKKSAPDTVSSEDVKQSSDRTKGTNLPSPIEMSDKAAVDNICNKAASDEVALPETGFITAGGKCINGSDDEVFLDNKSVENNVSKQKVENGACGSKEMVVKRSKNKGLVDLCKRTTNAIKKNNLFGQRKKRKNQTPVASSTEETVNGTTKKNKPDEVKGRLFNRKSKKKIEPQEENHSSSGEEFLLKINEVKGNKNKDIFGKNSGFANLKNKIFPMAMREVRKLTVIKNNGGDKIGNQRRNTGFRSIATSTPLKPAEKHFFNSDSDQDMKKKKVWKKRKDLDRLHDTSKRASTTSIQSAQSPKKRKLYSIETYMNSEEFQQDHSVTEEACNTFSKCF